MFVVAYPNENVQTEFEFKYWVDNYDKNVLDLALAFDFSGPMGTQALILDIVAFVVIIFLVISICGIVCHQLRINRN